MKERSLKRDNICSVDNCDSERYWVIKIKKCGHRPFCERHVPPVDTPGVSRYAYYGPSKTQNPNDWFCGGERIYTNIGGKRVFGKIINVNYYNNNCNVLWDGVKRRWYHIPIHFLHKLTALDELALVAD